MLLTQPSFIPTAPKIAVLITHFTAPPANTKAAAPRYPHPSRILNASKFCTATAQITPLFTQPTPLPGLSSKPGRKLEVAVDEGVGPGEVDSSGRHTIIKIGKSDMHELTNSAVDIELGVGGFGGSRTTGALGVAAPLKKGGMTWPSCCCLFPPHSPVQLASQRMVRCWDIVAAAQTRTKKPHCTKTLRLDIGEAMGGGGRDSMWIIVR